ncbi:MAG: helix-turn-helix domain-containing protein [Synechococcaceae cyanobacterium]|nr:helix-turn-helix domain-containing protein [Synechococcaceae cyanobacterium]
MLTTRPPKNPTKKWAWIIYQLALRGLNLSDIARDLGVTRQAICRANYGRRPRIERAIAARLDLPPCRIWPERYPECGQECVHHNDQTGVAQ